MSTRSRCSRKGLVSLSPLYWFNKFVHVRVVIVVVLQRSVYRNFRKCQFLMKEFHLFWALYRSHFSHDFDTWGVTFKGKAWQQIFISELFTVIGYLHTVGFKIRRRIFCASVFYTVHKFRILLEIEKNVLLYARSLKASSMKLANLEQFSLNNIVQFMFFSFYCLRKNGRLSWNFWSNSK